MRDKVLGGKLSAFDVKEQLINYLKMKTEEEDWHAVADAAMDLREIEEQIKMGRK